MDLRTIREGAYARRPSLNHTATTACTQTRPWLRLCVCGCIYVQMPVSCQSLCKQAVVQGCLWIPGLAFDAGFASLLFAPIPCCPLLLYLLSLAPMPRSALLVCPAPLCS
eukprot:279894-Chlamydomonas_euryale.AAC.1